MIMDAANDNPPSIDAVIGAQLRRERLARGVSRRQLSALIAVSAKDIQNMECGKARISAEMLFRIGRSLRAHPRRWIDALSEGPIHG